MLEFARQALVTGNEAAGASRESANLRRRKRITNALREAQTHLAIAPAELDTHADLLNFVNGTIDLKAGSLRRIGARIL